MHRSNNICPISAIWTVVCCVFDSAGFFIGVTYAGENTPYTSLKISLLPPDFAGEPLIPPHSAWADGTAKICGRVVA